MSAMPSSIKSTSHQGISRQADIGVIGLAVMGQNLALNLIDRGFTVAVFNRTVSKVHEFIDRERNQRLIGTETLDAFISSLKTPRVILLMVKAGNPIDEFLQALTEIKESSQLVLQTGDIVIDGGNSLYTDTERRCKDLLQSKGILFVGCGVSGGEEGARRGPSLMPGGASQAWPRIKPLLTAIAAHSQYMPSAPPCCDWLGEGGAGHFVKMVHNGIEYGDMQLIGEVYQWMRDAAGMSAGEIGNQFKTWAAKEPLLESFLIEATTQILQTKAEDENPSIHLIDQVKDVTGQKGTGKWTVTAALDLGTPVTLISEAVQARALSSMYIDRQSMAQIYNKESMKFQANANKALEAAHLDKALLAAKIISYAQGFFLLHAASEYYGWSLDYGKVAVLWSGGCIIRSRLLPLINQSYQESPGQRSFLQNPLFSRLLGKSTVQAWRQAVISFVQAGIPCPAMSSALSFFDGLCTVRGNGNLVQSLRDYFGAHLIELITDKKDRGAFHFDWIGSGGKVSSTNYQA